MRKRTPKLRTNDTYFMMFVALVLKEITMKIILILAILLKTIGHTHQLMKCKKGCEAAL